MLRQRSRDLTEEDDPASYDSIVAKTREGDPTVDVVLAYRVADTLSLTRDGTEVIDLSKEPRGGQIRKIVARSVSLSHQRWVQHFAALEVPSGWRRCGAMRFHRVAELNNNGVYDGGPGVLVYDSEVGVQLQRGNG